MLLCDAPGAALIGKKFIPFHKQLGINQGEDFLLRENLHIEYPSCIYICLDEEKTYMQEGDKIDLPYFDNFEKSILHHYATLNQHLDYKIVSFNVNNKNKTKAPTGKKKLKGAPTQEEKEACLKVLDIFKDTLFTKIVRHLPPKPILNGKVVLLLAL